MILVNSPLAVGKKVFRAIIITRELYLRVKLIFANYNISKRFMSKTIHTRNFNENFSKNSGRVFPTKVKTQSRKTWHIDRYCVRMIKQNRVLYVTSEASQF